MTATSLPAFSGRAAMTLAASTAAPAEMPGGRAGTVVCQLCMFAWCGSVRGRHGGLHGSAGADA